MKSLLNSLGAAIVYPTYVPCTYTVKCEASTCNYSSACSSSRAQTYSLCDSRTYEICGGPYAACC